MDSSRSTFARLFLAGVAMSGAHSLLLAALPLYLDDSGAGGLAIGVVVGSYAVTQAVFRTVGARLIDRLPQRPLLLGGSGLMALGYVGYGLVPVGWWLVAPRVLHGLGLAVFYTTAYAWLSLVTPPEALGRRLGWFGSGTAISIVSMPPLGVYLLESRGAESLFLAGLVLCGVALLLPVPSVRVERGGPERWRIGSLLAPGLLVLLVAATLGLLEAFLPLIAREREVDNLIGLYVVFGISLALGRVGGGVASDRLGSPRVTLVGALLISGFFAALHWAFGVVALTLLGALYGVSVGAVVTAAFAHVGRITPRERLGASMALADLANDLGVGLGAGLAGAMASVSATAVPWMGHVFGVGAVAAALALRGGRRSLSVPARRL